MADARFFAAQGPFTLAELATLTGAQLADASHGARTVSDVAPLQAAGPEHLSFLDNRQYVDAFAASRAGACIVSAEFAPKAPASMALLATGVGALAIYRLRRRAAWPWSTARRCWSRPRYRAPGC